MVSELPKFEVGACADSKSIGSCSVEIVCRSQGGIETVSGIACRSQNSVWIDRGISFGGVDHFGNSPKILL